MYNKEVRAKIIGNYERIRELKLEQMELMKILQSDCDHDSVIEFNPGNGTLRKCIICLLGESGPDYKILKTAHLEGPAHPKNDYDRLKPLKTILVVDENKEKK